MAAANQRYLLLTLFIVGYVSYSVSTVVARARRHYYTHKKRGARQQMPSGQEK
ncbi:unnamed protein product, partial [Adineta steineri]